MGGQLDLLDHHTATPWSKKQDQSLSDSLLCHAATCNSTQASMMKAGSIFFGFFGFFFLVEVDRNIGPMIQIREGQGHG